MTSSLSRRRVLAAAGTLAVTSAIPATAEPTRLTLAVSSNTLAYGGLRIAEAAKLFGRHGIEPRIVVMDSGNAAIAAVLSGSAEFSSSGPGEVLAARARGQKVVIVTNLYRGLSGSVVLAKAVAAKLGDPGTMPVGRRIEALNGLTIATPSPTSAYTHPIKSAAEAAKASVRFVYMAQPAMVAALGAGAVQGMIAGAPFSVAAVSNGSGVLWLSGPRGDLPKEFEPASSACLQTSEAYAGAHPEIVARLRAVFADLASFIADRPDDAKALLGAAYPQLDPPTLSAIFTQDARNWTQPVMTEDQIRQEIAIQVSTGTVPGVDRIPPASVLWPA